MAGLWEVLESLLETIQSDMFARAQKYKEDNTHVSDDFDDYKKRVREGGFFRIHWCGQELCEKKLQQKTKSTIRCIPFDAPEESGACIVCGADSSRRVIAGTRRDLSRPRAVSIIQHNFGSALLKGY